MKEKRIIKMWMIVFAMLVIEVSTPGCAPARETANNPSTAEIKVLFKLDPLLLGPTYGGERWVSPPTYGPVQAPGKKYVVEAKAEALDKNGQSFHTNFEWEPEDPEMVEVAAGQEDVVMITIKRAGVSRLQVTSQGSASKTLHIKAEYSQYNAIQVEISQ